MSQSLSAFLVVLGLLAATEVVGQETVTARDSTLSKVVSQEGRRTPLTTSLVGPLIPHSAPSGALRCARAHKQPINPNPKQAQLVYGLLPDVQRESDLAAVGIGCGRIFGFSLARVYGLAEPSWTSAHCGPIGPKTSRVRVAWAWCSAGPTGSPCHVRCASRQVSCPSMSRRSGGREVAIAGPHRPNDSRELVREADRRAIASPPLRGGDRPALQSAEPRLLLGRPEFRDP